MLPVDRGTLVGFAMADAREACVYALFVRDRHDDREARLRLPR